jgi:glycosyltransferase involved in cell wall biosynthesis
VVDDHLTPYRIPLFERLAAKLESFELLLCAEPLRYRQFDPPASLGFRHRQLPYWALRLVRPPFGEPRYVFINPSLLLTLLRLRPEVIVGYSYSIPAWTAFLAAKMLRAGFVSWSTDTLHTERRLGPGQRLSRRLLIGLADSYITASSDGRDKFQSYGVPADRIHIVHQRTFVDPLEPAARQDDKVSFLFVGALSRRKGGHLLLQALAHAVERRPAVVLTIVGSGSEGPALEAQAAELGVRDAIRFAGFVQPGGLASYYRQADAFVFPSLEDTFGVVVADAAAAGLPIVSSVYAGSTRDFVVEGVNGFAVDPLAVEELSDRLVWLADHPERRREMGLASRELAAQKTVEQAAAAFEAAVWAAARRQPG